MGLGKLFLLQSAYFESFAKIFRTTKGIFEGWFESHEGVGLRLELAGGERGQRKALISELGRCGEQ